jgi:hypothetical protein
MMESEIIKMESKTITMESEINLSGGSTEIRPQPDPSSIPSQELLLSQVRFVLPPFRPENRPNYKPSIVSPTTVLSRFRVQGL